MSGQWPKFDARTNLKSDLPFEKEITYFEATQLKSGCSF